MTICSMLYSGGQRPLKLCGTSRTGKIGPMQTNLSKQKDFCSQFFDIEKQQQPQHQRL